MAEHVNKVAEREPVESTAPPSSERQDPTHHATGLRRHETPDRVQRQIRPVVSLAVLIIAVLIVAYFVFQWFT